MYYALITLLIFSSSCKKPFPENPAGSTSRKFNMEEIQMLRYELENKDMEKTRTAVIKGLLWLLDFVQDHGNFTFIFTNYIPMLYEVSVINDDRTIKNIARRLIKNDSLRGGAHLHDIFDKDNIQDIILMIGILERINAPADKYIDYYNKNLWAYDGEKCRREFYGAVRAMDYDKLTDVICDYSHFRFAYKSKKNTLLRLPKDYRGEFLKKCAALPFKHAADDESGYHDQNYYATHVVFFITGYGEYRAPDTALTRKLRKYLSDNLRFVRTQADDLDLVGEYVECLKIFGFGGREEVRESINYIVSRQNPDGSWVKNDGKEKDPYDFFHPSWTSITALHYNVD
jgi:hypothetical protein